METKKIQHVSYTEVYVAMDGTEFNDQNECAQYEGSAYGVLKGRLVKMAVTNQSECDLFDGSGSDENQSYIVVPKNEDEVRTIQQLVYLKTYGEAYKKRFAERVEVGKVLVVTIGYEDEGVWVADLGEIVSRATDSKFKVVEAE